MFEIIFSDDSIQISGLHALISKYKYPNSIQNPKNWEIALTYCQKNMKCKSFSFLQKFLQNLEKNATSP